MGHNNLNYRNREKGLRYWGTERGSLHLSPHIFLCLPLFVSTLSHFLPFSLPTIACIISERLKDSWLSTLADSIYLSSLPSVFVGLSSETLSTFQPSVSSQLLYYALSCTHNSRLHSFLFGSNAIQLFNSMCFLIAYILCFCSSLCLYILCVQRVIYRWPGGTIFFYKTNV